MIRSPCLPTARRRRTKRIRTPDAAWSLRGSPQSAMLPVPSSIRLVSISAEPRRAQSLNAPSGAQCFPTTPIRPNDGNAVMSQCAFWCSVLSDLSTSRSIAAMSTSSQCTFWCSVLSDSIIEITTYSGTPRLNAPSGAQCFPSRLGRPGRRPAYAGLNAPSGAQCFPTWVGVYELGVWAVSMHLLVLSAFRPTRSCR